MLSLPSRFETLPLVLKLSFPTENLENRLKLDRLLSDPFFDLLFSSPTEWLVLCEVIFEREVSSFSSSEEDVSIESESEDQVPPSPVLETAPVCLLFMPRSDARCAGSGLSVMNFFFEIRGRG